MRDRSGPVSRISPSSWVAAGGAALTRRRRFGSSALSWAVKRFRLRLNERILRAQLALGGEHRAAGAQQRGGLRELADRGRDQRVRAVQQALQVRPRAVERGVELVDRGLQRRDGHRRRQLVDVLQQRVDRHRGPHVVGRDDRPVLQVRAAVAGRLEVDVLLADRRPVRDHRDRRGRDVRGVVVDLEVGLQPGRGEPHVADLADLDTAVADGGLREDAAGVGHLDLDLVGAEPDQGGGTDVAEGDVADPDHRDDDEEDQQVPDLLGHLSSRSPGWGSGPGRPGEPRCCAGPGSPRPGPGTRRRSRPSWCSPAG